MRRYIALILVFSLCFTFLYVYPKYEAEATPAVLAAALVNPAAVLLVAAGITISENVALDSLARWWYSDASQDVRNQLSADWNAAVNGVMNVSDMVWNNIRSWVQSKFIAGENTITSYYPYNVGTVNVVNGQPEVTVDLGSIVESNVIYKVVATAVINVSSNTAADVWLSMSTGLLNTGYKSSGSYNLFTLSTGQDYFYLKKTTDGIYLTSLDLVNWTPQVTITKLRFGIQTYSSGETADASVTYALERYADVTYNGADVITNSTWDWQLDGKREVVVPSTIDNLVGKNYNDVILRKMPGNVSATPVVANPGELSISWYPPDGVVVDHWEINYKLSSDAAWQIKSVSADLRQYDLVGLIPGQTYDVIVKGVDSAGNVVWQTDIKTITIPADVPISSGGIGELATSIGNVLSRPLASIRDAVIGLPVSIANSLGIDLTATEVNTLPMRNLALSFTTKFPFSIPWDLKKMITVPANQVPETFSFAFPYTSQTFKVPIPPFLTTTATWIRTGELILFAIGLALLTKNLVGG